ncbi:MAG: hypothetical protein ISS48_02925 [Candidatus Aenigmarchaeota archaeon]|nr:hypothetical protein [Candidatus Aenigmarchaeota archaeon]
MRQYPILQRIRDYRERRQTEHQLSILIRELYYGLGNVAQLETEIEVLLTRAAGFNERTVFRLIDMKRYEQAYFSASLHREDAELVYHPTA